MDFEFTRPELASSSPLSSPTASTRRFSQYKARTSSSSLVPTRQQNNHSKSGSFGFGIAEPPQKLLWKERVRQQVAARARQERQRRYERGRSEDPSSDASSEADPVLNEENMDDLDDELYRRVMMEERRRQAHYNKVTYEREFGDSDDILMDVEEFEQEMQQQPATTSSQEAAQNSATNVSNFGLGSEFAEEEDPEKVYEAYLPDLQRPQAATGAGDYEDDEFENEFEDIDPQMLAEVLDRQ